MLAPWKKKYDKPRQCTKKQRHHFADKGLQSQSYGFSSSYVWMWELDHKVGCAVLCLVAQSSLTLCDSMDCSPPGSSVHGNSPGKNTGVSCHTLLQGIFPTQGSNPGLPHCRQILYQLSHQRSPRIPEWVAYPFSSGSSWPRNRTRVSCTAGRFFISWATGKPKEGWAPKNCFWTVMLEKTFKSPLDSKEIKPVNSKGNQSWIFIRRTDAETEAPIIWPPDVMSQLIGKDSDAGKDWGQEEKGVTEDEMVE